MGPALHWRGIHRGRHLLHLGPCPGVVLREDLHSESSAADGSAVLCPDCRTKGRSVGRLTILHHIRHEQLSRVMDREAYRFCSEPDCLVVYYGNSGTRITTHDLREHPGAKVSGDERPLCYCFGFTEGNVRKEIEETGVSTVPSTIGELIKAGLCACEVRNPSGGCCLGEVIRTVKRFAGVRNRRKPAVE